MADSSQKPSTPQTSAVSPSVPALGPFGAAELAASNVDAFTQQELVQDPFWSVADLDTIKPRWNQNYPFQLLILDTSSGGYKVVTRFTLPISPQEMQIQTPFAIDTAVTLGGIIEQHNGTPLRMISLSGTTGLLPLRGLVTKPSVLQSSSPIFAGAVSGAQSIGVAIGQAKNLLGIENEVVNLVPKSDLEGDLGKTTGYYQFQLLERFLEAYAATKKTSDGRALRLGFAVWKTKAVYLVTPTQLSVSRSGSSPLEYMYQLQFKAWRRVDLHETVFAAPLNPGVRSPNRMAQVASSINESRRILEIGRNIMSSSRADIQNMVMEPLRQVHLFTKDATGAAMTVADFPSALIGDLREAVLESYGIESGVKAAGGAIHQIGQSFDKAQNSLGSAFTDLAVVLGKSDYRSGNPNLKQKTQDQRLPTTGFKPDKVMKDPKNFYEFFSKIKPSDLNLRPGSIKAINAERSKAQNLRREDFEKLRDSTLEALADFSDSVGAGSTTYDNIFGRNHKTSTRTPTDSDWDIMAALSQTAQALDSLSVSAGVNVVQQTPSDYIAGLASRSGIAFRVPVSKFLAPVPYGFTLEQISAHYLQDANRWLEISALNGLRAPYIDEIGFQELLLTNGSSNVVTVADGSNLYTGQTVWVGSTAVRREKRKIQGLETLQSGRVRVTLDGEPDLQKFTAAASSYIWAFLPDTVNSQMQIFIPSDKAADDNSYEVKDIPGIDYSDPYLNSGGIDLLLDPNGDLVLTPDGGCRLAIGITNIIQRARLAIGTPRGSLIQHPEYGFGIRPGQSTADIGVDAINAAVKDLFKGDPGISSVDPLTIQKTGNVLRMKLSIGLAATGVRIPVQIDVKH
jgi:hypothetical protein